MVVNVREALSRYFECPRDFFTIFYLGFQMSDDDTIPKNQEKFGLFFEKKNWGGNVSRTFDFKCPCGFVERDIAFGYD